MQVTVQKGGIHFIKTSFTASGHIAIIFQQQILQKIFDVLIDSFISGQVGQTTDFLNASLVTRLKDNLSHLYSTNQMQSAGTGHAEGLTHDSLFRNDRIYWLDRSHNDAAENEFFSLMDDFVSYLNQTCYTGITGYEFHYALYESGSFYKRHIDQFRDHDSRQYSMIMYLNSNWTAADGGQLRIFHADRLEQITPSAGRTVFFKSSELEHEVMQTNRPRMSITGWLKQ